MNKKLHINLAKIFLSSIFLALTMTSCDKKADASANVGTMVCIKSFENIMRQEIIVYENVYRKAIIGCQYVTENEALQRLMSGDTRLAVLSRDLTESEVNRLKSRDSNLNVRSMQIAVDALALIVNPDNPVDKLTMKEVARILKGEVKTWSQIQPGAPDIPIKVVVDDPQSSVVNYMREKVLEGGKFDPKNVVTADSVSGVFNRVKDSKGCIGVIGVSWLGSDLGKIDVDTLMHTINSNDPIDGFAINDRIAKSGVKTLGLITENSVALSPFYPTAENIYSGDYPLTRPIYMVTTAIPAGTLGKFYSFVTGVDGQKIIMKSGIMPARLKVNVYEIAN